MHCTAIICARSFARRCVLMIILGFATDAGYRHDAMASTCLYQRDVRGRTPVCFFRHDIAATSLHDDAQGHTGGGQSEVCKLRFLSVDGCGVNDVARDEAEGALKDLYTASSL
eukprot:PhM_4_TR2431/c0_g1_i5/m.50754